MTTKEKEKIKYAILLANMAGTSDILINFWATIDEKEIRDMQYDLYIRAYKIICNMIDGDRDFIGLSRYLFSDDRYSNILDSACEELQEKLKNIHEAVLRNIKYSDSKILIPPIAGNFLISNEERKINYAKRNLKNRGIYSYDTEKIEEIIEFFKEKYKNLDRIGE